MAPAMAMLALAMRPRSFLQDRSFTMKNSTRIVYAATSPALSSIDASPVPSPTIRMMGMSSSHLSAHVALRISASRGGSRTTFSFTPTIAE